MGEYLAQEIREEYQIDWIIGVKDQDIGLLRAPANQSPWEAMKLILKGPEKSTGISLSLSDLKGAYPQMKAVTKDLKKNGATDFQLSPGISDVLPKSGKTGYAGMLEL